MMLHALQQQVGTLYTASHAGAAIKIISFSMFDPIGKGRKERDKIRS